MPSCKALSSSARLASSSNSVTVKAVRTGHGHSISTMFSHWTDNLRNNGSALMNEWSFRIWKVLQVRDYVKWKIGCGGRKKEAKSRSTDPIHAFEQWVLYFIFHHLVQSTGIFFTDVWTNDANRQQTDPKICLEFCERKIYNLVLSLLFLLI